MDAPRQAIVAARRLVTTTDLWKLAGLVFILIDHYGLFFDEDQDWWRVFGRAAAPIFFFLIGFARTRRVPWSWFYLGVLLTAVDAWTSGEGLGRVNLNILINFAWIRLVLADVEAKIMPHPWRIALAAVAAILLIRPVQQIIEYGAEGWLWALFGLAHRLALATGERRMILARDALGATAVSVYLTKEIIDYSFAFWQAATLFALIATLALLLVRFRRTDLSWQPPEPVAALLRFGGRRSLEIYAFTLLAMQLTAYAVDEWWD